MNRQVTSIANHITQDQSQIATFTAQLASSQNSQTQLLAQLKRTVTNAKTTRALACKAGR
jgi:mannitol/fructose-specific phosphotransferase system IIA component